MIFISQARSLQRRMKGGHIVLETFSYLYLKMLFEFVVVAVCPIVYFLFDVFELHVGNLYASES